MIADNLIKCLWSCNKPLVCIWDIKWANNIQVCSETNLLNFSIGNVQHNLKIHQFIKIVVGINDIHNNIIIKYENKNIVLHSDLIYAL